MPLALESTVRNFANGVEAVQLLSYDFVSGWVKRSRVFSEQKRTEVRNILEGRHSGK